MEEVRREEDQQHQLPQVRTDEHPSSLVSSSFLTEVCICVCSEKPILTSKESQNPCL
uniref:Uncharacterized protein n=1 Tax=Arundo donax TaxID=35708 RepID=A0A0A9GZP5_ARUDO